MTDRPGHVGKSFIFRREVAALLAETAARLRMDQVRVLEALIEEYAPTLQVEFSANSSQDKSLQVTKRVKKRA